METAGRHRLAGLRLITDDNMGEEWSDYEWY